MKLIAVLGRQPELGIAELESVYGAKHIDPFTSGFVYIDHPRTLTYVSSLGSTVKLIQPITQIPSTNWQYIHDFLVKNLPLIANQLPEGKLTLGFSAYGIKVSPGKINATALTLKKLAKNFGRSVRIVPNKEVTLNSAQVLHNKLIGSKSAEIVFLAHKNKTILAQTVHEQDIDAYARRDQSRPARDARVGMLPPKLAQTIINLAVDQNSDTQTILDPFCGTGVILQEALLMGYDVCGTDLEPRMIDYSNKNLEWLNANKSYSLEVADATNYSWKQPFQAIACETYLGRPLSSTPDQETLRKIISDCDVIHKKFLVNVATQTQKGFRMCIAVPAWKIKNDFKHLPTLDNLSSLGYNRISFVHVDEKKLIYHREGQQVARELVVLERI